MSMNHICLMGRFTADPTLRHTNQGTPIVSFTLAVDRNGKDQPADFIDCVAFKQKAEFINSYFSKGRMAVAEGSLHIRDWTDTNGNKRRTAEVMVNDIYFGDSKREDPLATFTKAHPETVADNQFAEIEDDGGDNLPF